VTPEQNQPLAISELLKKAEANGLTVTSIGPESSEVFTSGGEKVAQFFWQPIPGHDRPRVYVYVDGRAHSAAYSHAARRFDELGEARQKEGRG